MNLHFLEGVESNAIIVDARMCGIGKGKVREIMFFYKVFGNCMLAATQRSSDAYEHNTVGQSLFDAVRSVKGYLKKKPSLDAKEEYT
jgi:hypothetical protein